LRTELTVDRFRHLLPEAAAVAVDRYELPNLLALNFVVHGLLGEGVASSTRPDAQAKSLVNISARAWSTFPTMCSTGSLDHRPETE